MTRFRSAFGLFIIAILMAGPGCGSKEQKEPEFYSGPYQHKTDDAAEAQKLASGARTVCGTNRDCSPAVGLVIDITPTADGYSIGSCTGFLIASNLLMTNAHCIPDDLKKENQPRCAKRLYFSVPAAKGYDAEAFECDRVLAHTNVESEASGSATFHQDFAIVKLDHAANQSRVLDISHEGLPDELAVTIVKAEVVRQEGGLSTPPVAWQRRQDCRFGHDTPELPSFNHPFRPLGLLPQCQIHKGNSGSPLIDDQSRVRAVLQAGSNVSEFAEQLARTRAEAGQPEVKGFALATNLSCVRELAPKAIVPAECAVTPDSEEGKQAEMKLYERVAARFIESFQRTLDANKDLKRFEPAFRWKPALLDAKSQIANVLGRPVAVLVDTTFVTWGFATPDCIETPPGWLEKYKNGLVQKAYVDTARIQRQFPLWAIELLPKEDGKLLMTAAPSPMVTSVIVEFSPKQLAATGKTSVVFKPEGPGYDDEVYVAAEIGACDE